MKKNFMTGLALFLPVLITYVLVMFLIHLFTAPFTQATTFAFRSMGVESGLILEFVSQFFILLFVVGFILATGLLASLYLVRGFLRVAERFVLRIPIINTLFVSLQEVSIALFSPESPTFSKVVLVPYPHKGVYALGLIAEDTLFQSVLEEQELISVFVPGIPNPTNGFMLTFPKNEILWPEMTVPEALKFILSFGVVYEK